HIYDISGSEVDSALGSTNSIETFNNLPQGSYTVVVTDAQGCSVRNELDIDQNVLDLIPLDSDPINCNDTSFPWRVRATGGTPAYEFRLVGDPTFEIGIGPDQDIFDLTGRVIQGVTYFVEV